MANKTTNNILEKLSIQQLNPMQQEAQKIISKNSDVVLLSPTGSGKTIAFLLPIIEKLDPNCKEIQVLILVPARELAIQIEQVTREMGAGFKVNAVYGGTSGSRDKMDLKHRPAILIGTPGRVASHLEREIFSTEHIKTLILDEFDKSLEVGFENEMTSIIADLPQLHQRILTSATFGVEIPDFVGMQKPTTINYLKEDNASQLELKTVVAAPKDKLSTLLKTVCQLGNQPGIIFCNFKDTIQEVSNILNENEIKHGCFHGGMEQIDRERTLIQFRNGTFRLLIATDLAARGIDIPEIKFILHYQLPHKSQEFTHRNGRTARMNSDGTAYIIKSENQKLPDFIPVTAIGKIKPTPIPSPSEWTTLHLTGGRKDKISKGDIAGLFFKQGKLGKEDLGIIELQKNSAYVAVKTIKTKQVLQLLNGSKLKKKNIRISML